MVDYFDTSDVTRLLRAAKRANADEQGAPLLIVDLAEPAVLWANDAVATALATSDRPSLTRLIFGGAGSRALVERMRRLRPGAPDQLERMSLVSAFHVDRLTLVNRVVDDAKLGLIAVILVGGAAVPQPRSTAALPSFDDEPAVKEVRSERASFAPSAETSNASWRSVEQVRSQYAAQGAQGHRVRFLFELDAEGRITSVDPPLAAVVGQGSPNPGDDLGTLLQDYAPDTAVVFRSAITESRSFSGLVVPWPIERSDAAVSVTLGGAPLPGGRAGFRGFGVAHLGQILALPRPAPAAPIDPAETLTDIEIVDAELPEATPPDAPDKAASLLRREVSSDDQRSVRTPGLRSIETPLREAQGEPERDNSKVVHLVRFKSGGQSTPPPAGLGRPVGKVIKDDAPAGEPLPSEPQWSETPGDAVLPSTTQLSSVEQSAFKEIARTLAARDLADGAETPDASVASGLVETSSSTWGPAAEAMLDPLPIGILVTREGAPLYGNRCLLDMFGLGHVDDLPSRDDAGLLSRARLEGAAIGGGVEMVLIRGRDGREVTFEVRRQGIEWNRASATMVTVRRASDGDANARVDALGLDLTRAQHLSRDLAEALDIAASGVAFLDSTGRILSINPAAERFFGYDQREVVGDTFGLFLGSEDQAAWSAFLAPFTAASQEPGRCERRRFSGRRRSGDSVWLNATSKLLSDRRIAVVWQSTSDAIGDDAEAARREAERTSSLKSEFLATVSHEIRTPLNAIIGFAEVMMEERLGPIGSDRYKEYLKDIHMSGTHVMSLVNDLLDLSRIEAGRLDLNIVPVNANTIVSECVATLQTQAHRERVILRLSLAPRLPPVLADERALRQIVLNLLSNAVKFNEPGGQVIMSTAITENGTVAIRVRDTGLGMSDEDIATAMEPFRQLATAKASAGSGLGLPLTKALVEASHASMVIKSRPREGTLVEVTFQQAPAEPVSVSGRVDSAASMPSRAWSDDNADRRMLLRTGPLRGER